MPYGISVRICIKNVTGAELIVDGGMSAQLFPRKLSAWKKQAMERGI